jgi:hypothetical protein
VIRKRGGSLQVQVFAGRDPLTGRKLWLSRQVRGQTKAACREAKKIEAQLLEQLDRASSAAAAPARSGSWWRAGWSGASRSGPSHQSPWPTTGARSTATSRQISAGTRSVRSTRPPSTPCAPAPGPPAASAATAGRASAAENQRCRPACATGPGRAPTRRSMSPTAPVAGQCCGRRPRPVCAGQTLRYVGVRPIDSSPVDGPPSSAHSGRDYGGRTIGPGAHSRASEKTNMRLRRRSHMKRNRPAAQGYGICTSALGTASTRFRCAVPACSGSPAIVLRVLVGGGPEQPADRVAGIGCVPIGAGGGTGAGRWWRLRWP